jgi:hypothetical protein
MANSDIICLYDMVECDDRVEIYPENEEGSAGYMW